MCYARHNPEQKKNSGKNEENMKKSIDFNFSGQNFLVKNRISIHYHVQYVLNYIYIMEWLNPAT
jgi:hypothetical protein